MLKNTSLRVTAWDGATLVGVTRSVADLQRGVVRVG